MIPNARTRTRANASPDSNSNTDVALNAFSSALAQNKWQKLCCRRWRRRRSRKLGEISVAKTKRAPLPLLSPFPWLPGHPWAVYQQQPTSAKVAELVVGGAWHAFINIYDSIKVCIRHSGGRAAAAAATPAAESLSPALVALCVCLFVCCALHATCKLQHKVKPRSKCNYEKPFELSRGKKCTSKYKQKTLWRSHWDRMRADQWRD